MTFSVGAAASSALLLLSLSAPLERARADDLDPRLLGAWVPASSNCSQVFEARDGALAFRRPIDTFSTSFIISREEIRASTGSCRIGRVSSAKDQLTISLSCENSVGFLPLNARVRIISGTQMTYGDAADDPLLDANYEKCAL